MRPIPLGFVHLARPGRASGEPLQRRNLPPVLATPVMIMVLENAALNAIRPYLDPGESAVGSVVDVRHTVPTPVGRQVTGEAIVTKVEGRRIDFSVRATEGAREIGAGSHRRIAIDVAKFIERLG